MPTPSGLRFSVAFCAALTGYSWYVNKESNPRTAKLQARSISVGFLNAPQLIADNEHNAISPSSSSKLLSGLVGRSISQL